jgi:hypothetical protein
LELKKFANLADVAPTLVQILGIPATKHSEGRVLEEVLE